MPVSACNIPRHAGICELAQALHSPFQIIHNTQPSTMKAAFPEITGPDKGVPVRQLTGRLFLFAHTVSSARPGDSEAK
ncbi:hypothetical protein BW686_12155 [Pseudomonas syringae]|uniref:Uncharacterized protein n=1 Tax=Pseudomonas syringae TaxID=317 RepID=A0A244ERP4_PSESX|nr:hypothetical protein BW686_12155 [Pseudomonas syringae]